MATIGSLAVNIVAKTDKFIAGLNNAQGKLGAFVKKIGVAKIAAAGAAATAGYAMGSAIKQAVEFGGRIQELTNKLHISAEALTALHFAANQLESSSVAVDAALAKMSVTLGRASFGAASAEEAFSRINLSHEELLKLPVEQQFLAVIDALNKVPDAAERAAAGQDIFGKGSKELSALISAGTEEIIRQGREAAAAGAVMSTSAVESLDNVGDAVASLIASWQILKAETVATFGPILTFLSSIGSNALKVVRGILYMARSLIMDFAGFMASITAIAGDLLNVLLPKKLEVNTEDIRAWAKGFSESAEMEIKKMRGMSTSGAANPLENSKQVEQNTSTTNKKLDELIEATRARGPQLQVAGVR